jgi:integrase
MERKPRGFYQRNGKWGISYFANGRWIRKIIGTNKRATMEALEAVRTDILNLTHDKVDFVNRTITVEGTKTGKVRVIPMNDLLLETLSKLEKRSKYVFSKDDGINYGNCRKSFEAAIKRAGIPYIRFHDLRHTFATRLVGNGVNLVIIKELLGHSDIRLTSRYSHALPEFKRLAVDMLNMQDNVGRRPGTYTKLTQSELSKDSNLLN